MGSDKPDYTLGISILEQALANLTAVVSATALDIRALDSGDIAHQPLPYNYKAITGAISGAIAQEGTGILTFDVDDWGADKDFYVVAVNLDLTIPAGGYIKFFQGFSAKVFENEGDKYPPLVEEDFNPMTYPPIRYLESGDTDIWKLWKTPFNKVDKTSTIACYLWNRTGVTLTSGNVYFTISGVII